MEYDRLYEAFASPGSWKDIIGGVAFAQPVPFEVLKTNWQLELDAQVVTTPETGSVAADTGIRVISRRARGPNQAKWSKRIDWGNRSSL